MTIPSTAANRSCSPANATFTTIRGLKNGTAYEVIVTALNDSGWGEPAMSRPVTPKR